MDPAAKSRAEEQAAEARKDLLELAKILGRATAKACHQANIHFDMDDPEVARNVMIATFEAVVYSEPQRSDGRQDRKSPDHLSGFAH